MKKTSKGINYTIEEEKLMDYMKLSTEDKLNWLEEINEFTNMVLNDKEKEMREKLRKEEI